MSQGYFINALLHIFNYVIELTFQLSNDLLFLEVIKVKLTFDKKKSNRDVKKFTHNINFCSYTRNNFLKVFFFVSKALIVLSCTSPSNITE